MTETKTETEIKIKAKTKIVARSARYTHCNTTTQRAADPIHLLIIMKVISVLALSVVIILASKLRGYTLYETLPLILHTVFAKTPAGARTKLGT